MSKFDIAFVAATIGFWLCFFLLIGLPALWFARDSWRLWLRTKTVQPWQRRRARRAWEARQEQIIVLLFAFCGPAVFLWLIAELSRG